MTLWPPFPAPRSLSQSLLAPPAQATSSNHDTPVSPPVTLIAPLPPYGLSFFLSPSLVPWHPLVPVGKLKPKGTTPPEMSGRARDMLGHLPSQARVSTQCLRSLGAQLQGACPGPVIPAHHPHTPVLLCLSCDPSQSPCLPHQVTLVSLKDYVRPHSGGWQSGVHGSVPTVLLEPPPLPFCRGQGIQSTFKARPAMTWTRQGMSGPGFSLCSRPQRFPTLPQPEPAPTSPENKDKEVLE